MNMQNITPGIYPVLGGFKKGTLAISALKVRGVGKSTLTYDGTPYTNHLCQEIMLPMKPEPKYKFSRKHWYVAEFDWRDEFEVFDWCVKQFGPRPKRSDAWSRWAYKHDGKIHFRDEKDYLMFRLKWS